MQVLHTHYSFPFSAANFATLLVECWSLLKCMNCIFVWLSIINFPVWCGHSVWVINCFLIKLTVHGKQVTLRSLGNIQVISSGQSAPSSGTTPLIYKAKDVQKTQSICCIITNISDVIFTLSSFSHSIIPVVEPCSCSTDRSYVKLYVQVRSKLENSACIYSE